ncbi:Coenzyme A biosynthesis bifunctional protein CoaBC [Roseimaritima ulvae]|uniref:Coenzyme A biosynthesis bifunctional protein CoaBC n=2 Tax=Roseimaritima ulvae TaxID=980254 RepID=A0A5B9QZN1_9BACT|nr:Coenzyme A biosynthesis bifunctional protein CoaBC [Roseimaritima ulvae]
MGSALAAAACAAGHEVVVISGPVQVEYPAEATVISVLTTDEMLEAACEQFARCDGVIGAAAPCDYRPKKIASEKISKNGQPYLLELVETADVIATLGQRKRADQWVVGFALETEDRHFRAIVKLERKHCDLMVSNGPEAIDADGNHVELIDSTGTVLSTLVGSKVDVAKDLMAAIQRLLIQDQDAAASPK